MLQKIKNSYFFSNRFFSLCLVFFISFSVFSFSFVPRKVVRANPLVGVFESEFAPIVVNILSSFGIVISIPTARDFLQQEKDYQYNLQMEFQKKIDDKIESRKALAQMGVQALEKGYLVSKEFVKDILSEWEDYCIKKNIKSETLDNTIVFSFPSAYEHYDHSNYIRANQLDSYYGKIFSSFSTYIPSSCDSFTVSLGRTGYGYLNSYSYTLRKSRDPNFFGVNLSLDVKSQKLFVNGCSLIWGVQCDTDSLKVSLGSYVTKPKINQKVIDNTLDPVNSSNQGMVISPENVEAVGKVLDPTIPDVAGSSVVNTAPISSVASTVPKIVNGSDVDALPWEMGGDKPVDGTDNPPISKPVDGADSIDKPIGGIGESIWDKILEFLKKILVPSDNFFIDEFKALEGELNGKFDGNGLNYISDFKNNSKSVDPKFVYTFTIMGTTVTLDFSFVTRIVPLCHIVFGGLTLLFLAWYHYKNVLLLIRGISPVEGGNFTGNSSGGGIDFKSMGDSAPSSPVSTISTSKGNSNYSTTNKYSGGAK